MPWFRVGVASPGTVILDQKWTADVCAGFGLERVLRAHQVVGLREHGIAIEDVHQPRRTTAGQHVAIMDRFWAATDHLAARDGGTTQTLP
jgi:hypothetical protein